MLTESRMVPTDATGPTRRGVPVAGDFILIQNAGGRHQSPGSYGYTRTEVLSMETRENRTYTSTRVETRAFGMGCWSDQRDYLIAVEEAPVSDQTEAAARAMINPVHEDHWTRLYYRAKGKYRSNQESSRIVKEVALAGIVADALAEIWPGEAHGDIFVADHTHEALSEGSCSVAWEGSVYDWTIECWDHPVMRALGDRFGIWFEPINGCILAVYRSR